MLPIYSQAMEARLVEGSVLEGKYRIVRVIGRGGMGVVYEAEHLFLKRRCAVKVLAPTRAEDEVMISRFKTEARSAANIVHPNVVEVLDFGVSPEGLPFFVMEYLEGESLGDRLKRMRRLSPAVAVEHTDQILRALSKAHKLGVVHRDLKPDNIFITRIDEVHEIIKVLDFGIVKLLDTFDATTDSTGAGRAMTVRGVVLGTPGYIAPESIFGLSNIDGRADLFSVGVLLYVMLTGKRPFVGDNAHDILVATLSNTPLSPRALRPELSEAMERLVLIALAKSPLERFAHAGEFLEYLTAAAVGRIPEDGRGLPTTTAGPWSMGRSPVAGLGPSSPGEETRSLVRPQIEADISAVLRSAGPDSSVVGAVPIQLDGRPSGAVGHADTPSWNDAPLGSIDPLDLSFDPSAPLESSLSSRARGQPMSRKADGSGLELDIESVRRSGVPLPSWSPVSESRRRREQTAPTARLLGVYHWLVRQATTGRHAPLVRRVAMGAVLVLALLVGVRLLSSWFLMPDAEVGIALPDGVEPPPRPPRMEVVPPASETSAWKKELDQVTLWLDVVPRKAKVTWAGKETTERPLVVTKGSEPVELVVSAPGHKSARVSVVPSHEQTLRIQLEPAAGRKGHLRRKR